MRGVRARTVSTPLLGAAAAADLKMLQGHADVRLQDTVDDALKRAGGEKARR